MVASCESKSGNYYRWTRANYSFSKGVSSHDIGIINQKAAVVVGMTKEGRKGGTTASLGHHCRNTSSTYGKEWRNRKENKERLEVGQRFHVDPPINQVRCFLSFLISDAVCFTKSTQHNASSRNTLLLQVCVYGITPIQLTGPVVLYVAWLKGCASPFPRPLLVRHVCGCYSINRSGPNRALA